MEKQEVRLSKFDTSFSSRARAHELFDSIQASELVAIDFSGVEEITPSFCHEMLGILLNEKKLKIKLINTDPSVKFQLNKALTVLKTS